MNTARTLIDQYKQAAEEKERLEQYHKQEAFQRAMEQFGLNCQTWLGPLWDELQVGDPTFYEGNGELHFRLPVSFLGLKGQIEHAYNTRQHRWNHTGRLDFGNLYFDDRNVYAYLNLNTHDTSRDAEAPSPSEMGALLALLEAYVPVRDEQRRKAVELRKDNFLNCFNIRSSRQWNEAQLAEAIATFPEMEKQFRARAEEVIEEIEELQRARQAENERYEAVRAEEERLQELAGQAWKTPFEIYLVTYGSFTDTDGETITRSFFSLTDHADEDGYWRALDGGRTTRRIKPTHVMSIERITVWNQGSAPYEIRRNTEIESKRLPGVTAWVSLPPLEVMGHIQREDLDAINEVAAA